MATREGIPSLPSPLASHISIGAHDGGPALNIPYLCRRSVAEFSFRPSLVHFTRVLTGSKLPSLKPMVYFILIDNFQLTAEFLRQCRWFFAMWAPYTPRPLTLVPPPLPLPGTLGWSTPEKEDAGRRDSELETRGIAILFHVYVHSPTGESRINSVTNSTGTVVDA
jgi:hypothetical protein